MKNSVLLLLIVSSLFSLNVFSQTSKDSGQLGLPGDNLDLYAVLDLFQKSKTIEDFEKSLNDEKSKINNLDLNNDNKVDFIKVVTNKKGKDFTFVLQDAVSKTETQDVAVILVSKDKNQKVTLQIVGDKALYGKDYIVEPKATITTNTANPGYTGSESATMNIPKPTTVVVVESAPIVMYVYSPAYVPYYPPYYYGYYPPYYNPMVVPIAIGVYHANHYNNYYHGGGYGNTTVIVNTNNYNNYNNSSRNSSTTVANNNANGNYKNTSATANKTNVTANNANTTTTNKTSANTNNSGNKPPTSKAETNSAKPSASPSTTSKAGASPSMRASSSSASANNHSRSSSSFNNLGGRGGRR
jgi:hypothetical protein